jgi:hypothetical protein
VIPVPEKDKVPVLKLVPVTVTFPVYSCSSLVGEILAGDGVPLVTVNAAASVPVCVSEFVTVTSLAVNAATALIVIFAVRVVALRVPYELTVIPVPLNDNVEVPAESNAVPVTVTFPV